MAFNVTLSAVRPAVGSFVAFCALMWKSSSPRTSQESLCAHSSRLSLSGTVSPASMSSRLVSPSVRLRLPLGLRALFISPSPNPSPLRGGGVCSLRSPTGAPLRSAPLASLVAWLRLVVSESGCVGLAGLGRARNILFQTFGGDFFVTSRRVIGVVNCLQINPPFLEGDADA